METTSALKRKNEPECVQIDVVSLGVQRFGTPAPKSKKGPAVHPRRPLISRRPITLRGPRVKGCQRGAPFTRRPKVSET